MPKEPKREGVGTLRIPIVVRRALDVLEGFRKGQRRAVLTALTQGGELVLQAAEGFEPGSLDEEPAFLRLLESVRRQGVSKLILDATQDPLFAGVTSASFRSALCLAARDDEGNVVGIFYADSGQAGAFDYEDLARGSKFAAELGPQIRLAKPARPRAERSAGPRLAVVCLGAALLWGLGGVLWHRPQGGQGPPPRPSPGANVPAPQACAQSILGKLQRKDIPGVYGLLSRKQQDRQSAAGFEAALRPKLEDSSMLWELQQRGARLARPAGANAQVDVRCVHLSPHASWTWVLVQEPAGWRLDSAQGGPLELSNDRRP